MCGKLEEVAFIGLELELPTLNGLEQMVSYQSHLIWSNTEKERTVSLYVSVSASRPIWRTQNVLPNTTTYARLRNSKCFHNN